jgi:hypothetical protein
MQAPLLALLQGCMGIDSIIPHSWSVSEPFDYHCSLLDVADVLRIQANNIPAAVPYIRVPDNLVGYWRSHLNRILPPARMRVGLVWQGNADHQADMFRSFALRELEPLCGIDGVQFISLQFGKGSEQLQGWNGSQPIHSLPGELDKSSGAFMDTAAILHHLDGLVTSDTSIAHLAGALARPTMVMLGYTPDWRWMLGRSDSPWYPTLRLYRQRSIGDWRTVALEVRNALEVAAQSPHPAPTP